jgi:hypothetical protein
VSGSVAYADEPIVIEHSDSIFSMAAEGTGWREHTLVARLQSDATVKKYGVVSIYYASSSEHVELLYVRVHHPDGTVAETQVSDAMDMPSPVTRQAYSDLKELQLPIRSLRVGDTLEFKYRIVRAKAEAPGQFWGQEVFSDATVVLSQTAELRVPAGMVVNVWSPTTKPVEYTADATATTPAQHIFRWTHSQLNPTAGKDAEAEAAAKKKILWTPDQEPRRRAGQAAHHRLDHLQVVGGSWRLVSLARGRPHRPRRHHQGQSRRTHRQQIHRRRESPRPL